MVTQAEISRLKALGHSQRQTAKLLGIHRNTVTSYWDQIIPMEVIQEPEWISGLDWDFINSELENKVPLNILFEELSRSNALPTYSSFCRMCSKKREKKLPEITVRVYRSPGESVETDYAGNSIDIYHPFTGEIQSTELFVRPCQTAQRFMPNSA